MNLREIVATTFVTFAACGPSKPPVIGGNPGAQSPCGGLDDQACGRAKGLLAAATTFSNVRTELILDPTSSFAHGRGLVRTEDGAWSAIPTQCARPIATKSGSAVDASTVDFGFVGVAIGSTLLGADVDIAPHFSMGAEGGLHKVRLVAVAYVRDLDPQFFDASDEVGYTGEACACRNATHFVGAVKMGGMLAYDVAVREGEVHGKALEFFKAHFSAKDVSVTETRVGGLEVEGLDAQLGGVREGAARPLVFRVKNPVPVAYAVYPISDVCKFSFPAPEVTPAPLDFGEAPYGKEATRLVHVVNRAPFDLSATLGRHNVEIPARATIDLPVTWIPTGDAPGCEQQSREEAMVFVPRAQNIPATPKQHSVRVQQLVRTGKGAILRAEHVETGEKRTPDYAATVRDWSCPPDHVVAGCRAQSAGCGDKNKDCTADGYVLTAETSPVRNGCHFGCTGPTSLILASNFCKFDAVMECRLACPR